MFTFTRLIVEEIMSVKEKFDQFLMSFNLIE